MTIWGQIITLFWIIINWHSIFWGTTEEKKVHVKSLSFQYLILRNKLESEPPNRRSLRWFEFKKGIQSVEVFTRHRDCEPVQSWAISKYHIYATYDMLSRDNTSFDKVLSHLKEPRRMWEFSSQLFKCYLFQLWNFVTRMIFLTSIT